jgi:hypothetical protein
MKIGPLDAVHFYAMKHLVNKYINIVLSVIIKNNSEKR